MFNVFLNKKIKEYFLKDLSKLKLKVVEIHLRKKLNLFKENFEYLVGQNKFSL